MFKSQLEPSPQNYETTALFVENIFDTVKKAKAAKAAAKSLAETKLMSPYDYSFADLSPKKKKPRRSMKKNAKGKKAATPKKKATLRKSRTIKDSAEKRKKASPTKTPRKYTKRVAKVAAPTDIDDEEAAFILSSISQRSFDSFYNRLNGCGSNKIQIPIDVPSYPNTNTSKNSVANQAYHVMLDHNYWIVEPEVPPEPVATVIVRNDTIVTATVSSSTLTQPEVSIPCTVIQSPVKKPEPEPEAIFAVESPSLSPNSTDLKEVNNNKVSAAPDSTAVKKRWLRQATRECSPETSTTNMKTPLKKRKVARDISEEKVKAEDVEVKEAVKVELLEEFTEPAVVKVVMPVKPSEPEKILTEPKKILAEPIKVSVEPKKDFLEQKKILSQPVKVIVEPEAIKVEPEAARVDFDNGLALKSENLETNKVEEPEAKPEIFDVPITSSVLLVDSFMCKDTASSVQLLIKKVEEKIAKKFEEKLREESAEKDKIKTVDDVEKMKTEIESKPAAIEERTFSRSSTRSDDDKSNQKKESEGDEDDDRHWDMVMEFHRLQLEKLTNANKRFAENPSKAFLNDTLNPRRFKIEEILSSFSSDKHKNDAESPLQLRASCNTLPRLQTRFSRFNKVESDPRKNFKASLSFETHHSPFSTAPSPFQRSTSEISITDPRRNRWGRNGDTTPCNSNSILPYVPFYNDKTHHKDEPYSKVSYSTYRAQKASQLELHPSPWAHNHSNDAMEPSWNQYEIQANNFITEKPLICTSYAADAVNSFKLITADAISAFPKESFTPLPKTKTSVSDPRLNPSLQTEARKEECATPKKKVKAICLDLLLKLIFISLFSSLWISTANEFRSHQPLRPSRMNLQSCRHLLLIQPSSQHSSVKLVVNRE